MIPTTRLFSQQLADPLFETPRELVSWMGALQAQAYDMAKWAVGIRLRVPSLNAVEEALRQGEIVRTHVMRPTWHFVAGEDIRWMLKLSAFRIRAANESYARGAELSIDEKLYSRANDRIEKILQGGKSLTRLEIALELERAGIAAEESRIRRYIARAETEGIVCNGIDRGSKHTYALLEERVAPVRELHKEEALGTLARRYFRSHSPATLRDFVWWSGLSMGEARHAVGLIEPELVKDWVDGGQLLVHETWNGGKLRTGDLLHLLPSYDEYLISYKERTAVLAPEHHPKAFNNWGIFYPVILHNGQIVGNWTKSVKKGSQGVATSLETSFFDPKLRLDQSLVDAATERYSTFISQ